MRSIWLRVRTHYYNMRNLWTIFHQFYFLFNLAFPFSVRREIIHKASLTPIKLLEWFLMVGQVDVFFFSVFEKKSVHSSSILFIGNHFCWFNFDDLKTWNSSQLSKNKKPKTENGKPWDKINCRKNRLLVSTENGMLSERHWKPRSR